jgi:Tetratricopeptide repeat
MLAREMRPFIPLVFLLGACDRCGTAPSTPARSEVPTQDLSVGSTSQPPAERPQAREEHARPELLERLRQSSEALREGRRRARANDWSGAREAFQRAVDADPRGHSPALGELGWALFQLGELQAAREQLGRALEVVHRQKSRGMLLYNAGRVAEASGERDRALAMYAESLRLRPNERVRERLRALAPADDEVGLGDDRVHTGWRIEPGESVCPTGSQQSTPGNDDTTEEEVVVSCETQTSGSLGAMAYVLTRQTDAATSTDYVIFHNAVQTWTEELCAASNGGFGLSGDCQIRTIEADVVPGGPPELVFVVESAEGDLDWCTGYETRDTSVRYFGLHEGAPWVLGSLVLEHSEVGNFGYQDGTDDELECYEATSRMPAAQRARLRRQARDEASDVHTSLDAEVEDDGSITFGLAGPEELVGRRTFLSVACRDAPLPFLPCAE